MPPLMLYSVVTAGSSEPSFFFRLLRLSGGILGFCRSILTALLRLFGVSLISHISAVLGGVSVKTCLLLCRGALLLAADILKVGVPQLLEIGIRHRFRRNSKP